MLECLDKSAVLNIGVDMGEGWVGGKERRRGRNGQMQKNKKGDG